MRELDLDVGLEEGEEEAGACMIYEFEERFTGVYYAEGDIRFTAHGNTREECLQDMLDTINYLPGEIEAIGAGEASLVDVVPLKRGERNE